MVEAVDATADGSSGALVGFDVDFDVDDGVVVGRAATDAVEDGTLSIELVADAASAVTIVVAFFGSIEAIAMTPPTSSMAPTPSAMSNDVPPPDDMGRAGGRAHTAGCPCIGRDGGTIAAVAARSCAARARTAGLSSVVFVLRHDGHLSLITRVRGTHSWKHSTQ